MGPWPAGDLGQWSTIDCPSGNTGNMSKYCGNDGYWDDNIIDHCVPSRKSISFLFFQFYGRL